MNVNAIASNWNSMAITASEMKSSDISAQLSTAVLKNIMDNQKMVAEALVQMMSATPSLTGTGSVVDISA